MYDRKTHTHTHSCPPYSCEGSRVGRELAKWRGLKFSFKIAVLPLINAISVTVRTDQIREMTEATPLCLCYDGITSGTI